MDMTFTPLRLEFESNVFFPHSLATLLHQVCRNKSVFNHFLLHPCVHVNSLGICMHCIALHCFALHCIALRCVALHYITLHYITLHYITLHITTPHYTTLHYTRLHYTTLRYTALRYITLRCVTLRYDTYITYISYIPVHACTQHACRQTDKQTYVCTYIHT